MRRSRRVLEAYLFPAWEQWVVHVPEADDVHAIVLDPSEAAEVALVAAALVLGVDRSALRIALVDGTPAASPAVASASGGEAPSRDPHQIRGSGARRRLPRRPARDRPSTPAATAGDH